jgi:hypothetical protein
MNPMSEQPQEWTPEWFETTFQDHDWIQQVCDAHNAALATEREDTEKYRSNCLYWKEQLAAEREKYKFKANLTQEIVELQQQLAAVTKQRDDFRLALEKRVFELDELWKKGK